MTWASVMRSQVVKPVSNQHVLPTILGEALEPQRGSREGVLSSPAASVAVSEGGQELKMKVSEPTWSPTGTRQVENT